MTPLQHALVLAAAGWPVFPCQGKQPLTAHGFKDAATDPATIAGWWGRWPAAWVGVSCGPAGLLVVDCDTDKAGDGLPERWRQPGILDGSDVFCTVLHDNGSSFPHHVVYTPSGGAHYYYRVDDGMQLGSPVRLYPLVDVRSTGAYVIAAGPGYVRCTDPADMPTAPDWLMHAVRSRTSRDRPAPPTNPGSTHGPGSRLRGVLDVLAAAQVGERNNLLHWAACRVAELDVHDRATGVQALAVVATAIGLGDDEAARTIRSALDRQGALA